MTKFKDALSDLVTSGPTSKARRSFARRTAVEKALTQLDEVVSRKLELGEPIEQFQARILAAFANGQFDSVSVRDLRKIPWALWGGAMPLSEHPNLVSAYADAVRRARRTSWFSTLRQAYFLCYQPGLAQAELVLELLREGQGISKWRWAEPSARFELFESREPSRSLLGALSVSEPAQATLERAGFQLGLESCNYVGHVFKSLCGKTNCKEAANEKWIWEFCQDEGSLRYPEHGHALVEAFLSPWEDVQPPANRRSTLIERLLSLFGDPRINRARWDGISQSRIQQFIGLLTRDSIEMFLDIVGNNALEHQWKYRRAFWMSYLNAGVITDAWVLFGPEAYDDARRLLRESGTAMRYARLNRPASKDQSVLLLKLGDLTIAEFSHNGRVWIWPPKDAKDAPRLYRSSYIIPDVTGSEIEFVHAGSETFRWQTNVAQAIRKYSNVKPVTAEWKPK